MVAVSRNVTGNPDTIMGVTRPGRWCSVKRGLALAAAAVLLAANACGSGDDEEPPADRGSLTDAEYDLAVDTAKQIQSEVEGTFVGATAIASEQRRPPCDKDAGCPDKRLVYVRLVWNADANFEHSGPVNRPDGPHKALLVAVDPFTDDIVSRAASYWSVAPDEAETLLYGQRL
jgi:hypothetical protein